MTLEEKLLFNRLISLKSFIFLTVCLFAIVACGGDTSDTAAPTVSTEPAAEQPAAKEVEIFLEASTIGKFQGTKAATTPTG